MAHFDSELFRAIADGPNADNPTTPRRNWTQPQIEQYEKSKKALYEVVMRRAARLLEITSQNDDVEEHKRLVHIPLTVTIVSKAAERNANGTAAKAHSKSNPKITFRVNRTDTDDAGIVIDQSSVDDDQTKTAIETMSIVGLTCPNRD